MNEELKRIKEKDYTKVDTKLLENMSKADNLDYTITHLSELQKFLIDQINNIDKKASINEDVKKET